MLGDKRSEGFLDILTIQSNLSETKKLLPYILFATTFNFFGKNFASNFT